MNLSARSNHLRPGRLVASAALAAVVGIALAGCKTTRTMESDSTSAMAAVPPNEADARATTAAWAERYNANPNDAAAAINYAHGLRATGQRAQAAAVLEQAVIKN